MLCMLLFTRVAVDNVGVEVGVDVGLNDGTKEGLKEGLNVFGTPFLIGDGVGRNVG